MTRKFNFLLFLFIDNFRKQHMSLISDKFRVQLNTMKEHTRSKLEDEKIMQIENTSNQRMLDLMNLQAREEKDEILKQEYKNLEKEKQLFEEYRKASKYNHQQQMQALSQYREQELSHQNELINSNNIENDLRVMQFKHEIDVNNQERYKELQLLEQDIKAKYDAQRREMSVRSELLDKQKNIYSDKIYKAELLRDQQRLSRKMKEVEQGRKELGEIIQNKQIQEQELKNARERSEYEKQILNSKLNNHQVSLDKEKQLDNLIQNIQKEKCQFLDIPYDSMEQSVDSNDDFLEEISCDKESEFFESFDKEYQERIEKERKLNQLLKHQETQLRQRKQMIEKDIKYAMHQQDTFRIIDDTQKSNKSHMDLDKSFKQKRLNKSVLVRSSNKENIR